MKSLDHLPGAGRVGGMYVDDADVKGALLESCALQELNDRPDRVVPAEIVVKPQLVDPSIPIAIQKRDPLRAGAGHFGIAAVDEGA